MELNGDGVCAQMKKVYGQAMVERGEKVDCCQYELNLGRVHHYALSCILVMDEKPIGQQSWGDNITGLLSDQIWVITDCRLEEGATQIVENLETVMFKPNKQLTRKERLEVMTRVDSYPTKWVAETKRKRLVPNTRGWQFDRIDKWHSTADWVPMFGTLGPAGIGKSVIIARL